jgi:hypothetical protein
VTPSELVDAVPVVVWLVVDALAVYRLTRLATRDSFPPSERLRATIERRWGGSPWSELAVCPWCLSWWIGAVVVAARLTVPAWWSLLALTLTYSAAAGWLASRE